MMMRWPNEIAWHQAPGSEEAIYTGRKRTVDISQTLLPQQMVCIHYRREQDAHGYFGRLRSKKATYEDVPCPKDVWLLGQERIYDISERA
jgi:hypothetical protein